MIEVAPDAFAHASGALWLPDARVAVIADLHLGYAWAQRRRGMLGPLVEGGMRERVTALLDALSPSKLVVLGDVVHAPRPAAEEREAIDSTLALIASRAELLIVRGNHDRGVPDLVTEWRHGKLRAVHGDCLPRTRTSTVVCGHFHPSISIRDSAGATQRVRVFLASRRLIVLPAFSPFAKGMEVRRDLPRDVWAFNRYEPFEVIAVTGQRAVRLKPLTLSA